MAAKAKTYKIVTGRQETELVEADRVELDSGRLNLYLGDDLVASYVGYSSFNPHNPVPDGA